MWKWWFSLFMCVFCAPVRMCVRVCVSVHACERCCKLCGGLSGKKQKRNKTGRGMKDVCVELYFKCVARETAFIMH